MVPTSVMESQTLISERNTDHAYVMRRADTGLLRTARLHHSSGQPVFHIARTICGIRYTSVVNGHTDDRFCIAAKRHVVFRHIPWYMIRPLNVLTSRVHESGLLEHGYNVAQNMFELIHGVGGRLALAEVEDEDDALDDVTSSVWYALGIALGVAFVVFVMEHVIVVGLKNIPFKKC